MSKIKRQNKSMVSDSDKLDSSAPVETLINYFRNENENAFKFYVKAVGRRNQNIHGKHWNLVGFPVTSFPADWNGEFSPDYFERFTYKSTLPKIITPMKNLDRNDPLTDYMKLKNNWQSKMTILQSKTDHLKYSYERLNDKVVYCPKVYINMTKVACEDPDPNFSDGYNWYYSGHGNLQILTINNLDYLMHSEFSSVYLSEFNKEDLKINAPIVSFDCGKDTDILETVTNDKFVILRTMYKIFVLKLVATVEHIDIEKVREVTSKMAFTSVTFDSLHKNIFYITKVDNSITIVNTDRITKKEIVTEKAKSLLNNWNTVSTVDRVTYCHITRDCITMYDKRTQNKCGKWEGLLDVTEINCNVITAARKFGDCFYLGTSHHILAMDMRFCSILKPKILQRWTHNMVSTPVYMNNKITNNGKDLLCISSQWCEDMCLVNSSGNSMIKGEAVTGVSPVFRPASILDTFKEARSSMLCYDLYNPIDGRLLTAITGMVFIDNDATFVGLQLNSLGDITAHVIYPEYMEVFIQDDNDSKESLHSWSLNYKVERDPLQLTKIFNCSKFLSRLKKMPDDTKYFDGVESGNEFSMVELAETFSSEELDSGLLQAWGVTVEQLEEAAVAETINSYSSEIDENKNETPESL